MTLGQDNYSQSVFAEAEERLVKEPHGFWDMASLSHFQLLFSMVPPLLFILEGDSADHANLKTVQHWRRNGRIQQVLMNFWLYWIATVYNTGYLCNVKMNQANQNKMWAGGDKTWVGWFRPLSCPSQIVLLIPWNGIRRNFAPRELMHFIYCLECLLLFIFVFNAPLTNPKGSGSNLKIP